MSLSGWTIYIKQVGNKGFICSASFVGFSRRYGEIIGLSSKQWVMDVCGIHSEVWKEMQQLERYVSIYLKNFLLLS